MCLRFQFDIHPQVCVLHFLKKIQIRVPYCEPIHTYFKNRAIPPPPPQSAGCSVWPYILYVYDVHLAYNYRIVKVPHFFDLRAARSVVPVWCIARSNCWLIPASNYILKGTVSRDFLLLVFLMNQFLPSPRGPFRIFSKIRGDIRKSRCTTGINDTGGELATGVNDTGGQ